MGENKNAKFVEKRKNRPSGIRFKGVPPPSTMYKNSKNIERTLFWMAKLKTRSLPKTVKIDPQEYVYQVFPHSIIYKNSKNIERTLFLWAKAKTRTLSKNVKIDPQDYVYQGSPTIMPIETPKTYITSSVTTLFYLQKLQK